MECIMENEVTCRTCLKEINKRNSIPINTVSDLITSCTSIQVGKSNDCRNALNCAEETRQISELDGLPSRICKKCHVAVRKAYDFRVLCEKSDKELRRRHECKELHHEVEIKQEEVIEVIIEESPAVKRRKPKLLKCGSCNKSFISKRTLQKHESEMHKRSSPHDCYKCGKTFANIAYLKAHIRRTHTRIGGHLCTTCGKEFTLPANLVRHLKIHRGDKQFHCTHCEKSFVQSGELKTHLITHTAEKAYLCNICGNKFARKQSLRIHVRRIHLVLPKSHTCELCDRSFKNKEDLRQHTRIHAEQRQHVCKVCSKAFNRKSNLTVHEYTHSNQRPHVCPVCQKGFIQRNYMKAHVQKVHGDGK